MGDDKIFISQFQPAFGSWGFGACELSIGVYGRGASTSTFTLTVAQEDDPRLRLTDGIPLRGVLEAGRWQYFSLDMRGFPRAADVRWDEFHVTLKQSTAAAPPCTSATAPRAASAAASAACRRSGLTHSRGSSGPLTRPAGQTSCMWCTSGATAAPTR
jgi:hypothetical protein